MRRPNARYKQVVQLAAAQICRQENQQTLVLCQVFMKVWWRAIKEHPFFLKLGECAFHTCQVVHRRDGRGLQCTTQLHISLLDPLRC
jgi:hypothetical protein